jgi:hypothetical protein
MHPFRFGVVAAPQGTGRQWRDEVLRVADLGFTSLLTPDVTQLLSPLPALATVAAISHLRVGTFVLAAPQAARAGHGLPGQTAGRP